MRYGDLHLEVDAHRIVVSVPGTQFQLVFFKSEDRSLTEFPGIAIYGSESSVRRHDFEAMAWQAATIKARDLGWID